MSKNNLISCLMVSDCHVWKPTNICATVPIRCQTVVSYSPFYTPEGCIFYCPWLSISQVETTGQKCESSLSPYISSSLCNSHTSSLQHPHQVLATISSKSLQLIKSLQQPRQVLTTNQVLATQQALATHLVHETHQVLTSLPLNKSVHQPHHFFTTHQVLATNPVLATHQVLSTHQVSATIKALSTY